MAELEVYEIKQGTDCKIEIPDIKDANGILITTSQISSVKAQARSFVGGFVAPNPLYTWTYPGPPATIEVATGKVFLVISAAVSSAWTWRMVRFDVELTDSASKVSCIADAFIRVIPEQTL